MPDKRRHRGPHPEDGRLFAPKALESLRSAVREYAWLLSREYAKASALKLVGDRYNLTSRQRSAVWRSACTDQSRRLRRSSRLTIGEPGRRCVAIDGYNLLITIESALSGGVILIGQDRCYRDLASVHGTYRKIQETQPAVALIADYLRAHGYCQVDWYLDRPVANSGRLKALMTEVVCAPADHAGRKVAWNIELVGNPDAVLMGHESPVITSDSVVLDRCGAWINLAAGIIDECIETAWKIDLSDGAGDDAGEV